MYWPAREPRRRRARRSAGRSATGRKASPVTISPSWSLRLHKKREATQGWVAYRSAKFDLRCRRSGEHLFAYGLVMLLLGRCRGEGDLQQLRDGLHVVHRQPLQLLGREVFLHVLAVVLGQDDVFHAGSLGGQGFFLDAADR